MAKFIPVIKHTDGRIEVFTTKFGGMFFDGMTHASLYVSDYPSEFWYCLTKEIAKMRAKDAICCEDRLKKAKAFFIEV